MTTRTQKDQKGRRAIGWGAGILLIGVVLGVLAALLPAFSGWRLDPPFGMGWFYVIGSFLVALVGIGFIGYGFVQLGRSRRTKEEVRRDREERRVGAWRHPRESH